MDKSPSPIFRKISAVLNIFAGILFFGAGINIFGATPGPSWMWFIFSAFFVIAGVLGFYRQ
jgi:hypothetical protein